MLQSWGEGSAVPTDNPGGLGAPAMVGDATWLYRHAFSVPWAAPGGAPDTDYAGQFSSSALVYDRGRYHFEGTLDMVHDVQSWLDHPESNYGWMLMAENEDTPFTARRFGSREDPTSPPLLMIDYEVVPEPGSLLLWALALVGFPLFLHRRRISPHTKTRLR